MVVLGGIDNDADAAATYELNFPNAHFARADIRHLGVDHVLAEFGVDTVDRVVFSTCAPCQPFSKQRTVHQDEDDRIPLLLELGRYVRAIRPDLVFVENVPGLQSVRDEESPLTEFLQLPDDAGYSVSMDVVEARSFGVPQKRSRLVVLASRSEPPGLPITTHGGGRRHFSTVREWIGDLPVVAAGEEHPTMKNHKASALSVKNLERIRSTPEGGDRRDWPGRLWLECHSGDYEGHTDVYGRMRWDATATGLTTRCISYSNGRFGHPEQDRALSIREAASLQTFPLDFEFVGSMASMARQIGECGSGRSRRGSRQAHC